MGKFPKQRALLIRTTSGPDFLEGLLGACDELGWRVVNLDFLDAEEDLEDTPVGAVVGKGWEDETTIRLREAGVPIVRIWHPVQEGFRSDVCLSEDRYAAGQIAADAFAERGFKDYAFFTYEEGTPNDALFVGFRERIEIHGGVLHLCNLEDSGIQNARDRVENLRAALIELPKPLAVLAINQGRGIRTIAACVKAGLAVPEQVAIICRGNNEVVCRTALVPLSAVDMNLGELGRQAVQMVKRICDGETFSDEFVYIPVKGFVPRRSTDILAVPDPTVAKAMRFIWDHLSWPLSVDDVAFETGTSRATLERLFSKTLGRGINGEIRRKRLEVCKELLRTTKLPLNDIAKAVGLTSRRYLHHAFKKTFDMTPQEYRKSEAGS